MNLYKLKSWGTQKHHPPSTDPFPPHKPSAVILTSDRLFFFFFYERNHNTYLFVSSFFCPILFLRLIHIVACSFFYSYCYAVFHCVSRQFFLSTLDGDLGSFQVLLIMNGVCFACVFLEYFLRRVFERVYWDK